METASESTAVTGTLAYRQALVEQGIIVLRPRGHVQARQYGSNAERQKAYRRRKKAK